MAGAAKKATRPRAEAAAGSTKRSKLKKKVKRRSKLHKRYRSSCPSCGNIKITMKVERSLHPSRRTKSQRPIHTRIQEEPSTSQQSRPSGAYLVREQMNKNDNPSAPAAAEAVPPCPTIATVPIEAVDVPTPRVGPKS